MRSGVASTTFKWIKRDYGYQLRNAAGGTLGSVEHRPRDGGWMAWFDTDLIAHKETFPTRRAAGEWLIALWYR